MLVARLEGRVNHSVAKRPEVRDKGRVRDRPRVVDGVEVCSVEDEVVVPVRGGGDEENNHAHAVTNVPSYHC